MGWKVQPLPNVKLTKARKSTGIGRSPIAFKVPGGFTLTERDLVDCSPETRGKLTGLALLVQSAQDEVSKARETRAKQAAERKAESAKVANMAAAANVTAEDFKAFLAWKASQQSPSL